MKRPVKIISVLALVLIVSLTVLGCSSNSTTPSSSTATSTTGSTSATKTLNIAMNMWIGNPLGIDQLHATQVDVEAVNASGGLDIGGTKYLINLIIDDTKDDDATAKTNAQKEIFQDKVSFILGDVWNVPAYIDLAESNNVVLISWSSSDVERTPQIKNTYHGTITDTSFELILGYAHFAFPNLKTYLGVFPDNEMGRGYPAKYNSFATNSGLTPLTSIIYPPDATDLSAVGTKIKALNPDILGPYGGGPPPDSQVIKAAYDAGWRGQVIGAATIPGETMIGIAGAAPVDGMVALAWPAEFEPATHPSAKVFKTEYTAKFGKWDNPEVVGAIGWWVMKAGLQQAGSIDPAKVRAVLDNGMKFDSIGGDGEMINRPDYGITRTMEVILGDMPVKLIKNGQVSLIHTFSLDEAITLWKQGKGMK